MNTRLMILPAKDPKATRLIKIPDDYEEHEVFRHVVGLIAQVEEENPDYTWEDINAMLEDRGFEPVEFILGPELD
jgi:glucuronate isomerase